MEGKTHRIGGTVGALAGYIVMKESGFLLNEQLVNPALQLVLIYTSGIYGGMWSDNDHHWASSPFSDPLSWVQNKVLHLANKPYKYLDEKLTSKQKRKSVPYKLLDILSCRHRSWQTHSEFTLFILYLIWVYVNKAGVSSQIDRVLWYLLLFGFTFGVVSHIILDSLTTEGAKIATTTIANKLFNVNLIDTVRFVPNSSTFSTGSEWEHLIRNALRFTQYILLSIVMGYLLNIDVLGWYMYVISLFSIK